MKQLNFIYLAIALLATGTSVAFADTNLQATTSQLSQLTTKLTNCIKEGNTRDFCINKYKTEINAVMKAQETMKPDAVQQQGIEQLNTFVQTITDQANQATSQAVNAIPGKPLSSLPAAQAGAAPQPAANQNAISAMTDAEQSKAATHESLLATLNAEASKVPGYNEQLAKLKTIAVQANTCQASSDPTCATKYQAELSSIAQEMIKIIKASINNGNTALKTAYDNFNNFAKANGMQTME